MAKDDLESSEFNLKNKKYYVSAFLSHQSVEKALKAFLLENNEMIIKVHDLVILGKKVNLSKDLLDKCSQLSEVYIETRYGFIDKIPSQRFNEINSKEYFNIAKEVLSWAEKNI